MEVEQRLVDIPLQFKGDLGRLHRGPPILLPRHSNLQNCVDRNSHRTK